MICGGSLRMISRVANLCQKRTKLTSSCNNERDVSQLVGDMRKLSKVVVPYWHHVRFLSIPPLNDSYFSLLPQNSIILNIRFICCC